MMKNVFKKALSVFLAVLMLVSCCIFVSADDDSGRFFGTKETTALTDEDFLTASGNIIVNRRGEKVTLRGVNIGAWLIWEDWLVPYTGTDENGETVEDYDHYTVLTKLEERFGREKAYELMNIYYDNFITEKDFDNIAAMGFNCVRIPFWFRNFYYDDDGTKIYDENGDWDFSRLDWAVEQCKQRGLYVILDMHGAVGYQSDAPHNGKKGGTGIYAKTQQGERYRELTDELWTAIATRFKDEPAVAMYDLLNEPMCDVNTTEVTRRINNEYIYTRLYETVRKVDEEHIITLECIWTAAALPHAYTKGWENVVYQVHFYQNSNFIFNLFVYLTRLYFIDVPLIMGEFYPHKKTTWDNCFKTMERCGFNWMLWTYKASNEWMTNSDWCLVCNRDWYVDRANIDTDSFEEIARKWGEPVRTENYQSSGHYENNVSQWLCEKETSENNWGC